MVVGGLGPVRTVRSSLIRRKTSLMSGFNSLLGTIISLFHFAGNLTVCRARAHNRIGYAGHNTPDFVATKAANIMCL